MGSIHFHHQTTGTEESVSVVDFCEPNLNILAHAQAIELGIGSRCGGHGKCGGDRVKALGNSAEWLSPVTDDERKHLSAAEIDSGIRLGCQCFPENPDAEIHFEIFI